MQGGHESVNPWPWAIQSHPPCPSHPNLEAACGRRRCAITLAATQARADGPPLASDDRRRARETTGPDPREVASPCRSVSYHQQQHAARPKGPELEAKPCWSRVPGSHLPAGAKGASPWTAACTTGVRVMHTCSRSRCYAGDARAAYFKKCLLRRHPRRPLPRICAMCWPNNTLPSRFLTALPRGVMDL